MPKRCGLKKGETTGTWLPCVRSNALLALDMNDFGGSAPFTSTAAPCCSPRAQTLDGSDVFAPQRCQGRGHRSLPALAGRTGVSGKPAWLGLTLGQIWQQTLWRALEKKYLTPCGWLPAQPGGGWQPQPPPRSAVRGWGLQCAPGAEMASPAVLSPARKISAALSLCQRFPGINSTLMDLPDLAAAPFSCHGTHRGPGCESTTRQHGALCLRLGQDHELWPGFLSVLPVSWFGAGRARAHCAKTGCSAPKMEPQELSADLGFGAKG